MDRPDTGGDPRGLREARELEAHLRWLDSFTPAALGVLAVASGIYTYLGVTSLLDGTGTLSTLAALAYSIAVSTGIFVFWSYLLRLMPSVRSTRSVFGLMLSGLLGSAAIIAMSSWLNAAALAGGAAVEQHLARTVQDYQTSLERANEIALSAQALQRNVAQTRQVLAALAEQEATGGLSGVAGRGAVFRLVQQKVAELEALEAQIAAQEAPIADAFAEGNAILGRMRQLLVEQGPVAERSVRFSEESVRLADVITRLRQLQVAPLVARAAADLPAASVMPELDGASAAIRADQETTMGAVLAAVETRAASLRTEAEAVMALPPPRETTYTPISAADAVIRYAGSFVPSWAGAIAIDLLPAVLVCVLMVTQSAIRRGREGGGAEDSMTLSDLRTAMRALGDIEASLAQTDRDLRDRTLGRPDERGEAGRPDGGDAPHAPVKAAE